MSGTRSFEIDSSFGVKLHRVTKLLRSTNVDFSIGSFLDRKQLRKLMQHDACGYQYLPMVPVYLRWTAAEAPAVGEDVHHKS